jgi:small GTP-binding protein
MVSDRDSGGIKEGESRILTAGWTPRLDFDQADMPTNLPPEYFEVEKRFRAAKSPEEKKELLEEMLSAIPKHKGTDKLRADLRRKLSKMKDASEARAKVGRRESVFNISREGAGQVVVVGSANVGKSSLVAKMTNAEPEVAVYPFTTRTPTPGMAAFENVQIQLIDTPALNRDHVEAELVDMIRRADLALIMVDLRGFPIDELEETIAFLEDHRIFPERDRELHPAGPRMTFLPFIIAVNKVDDESYDEDYQVFCQLLDDDWRLVPISTKTGRNLNTLAKVLFESLNVMRVYSKKPGKEADLDAPYVMTRGSTVQEFAASIHQDFYQKLKSARVWGSAEFDGQQVGRDHVLRDGDVVELRI